MRRGSRRDNSERQNWMAMLEHEVVRQMPEAAGRIDWDTAAHLFNTSHSVTGAAQRMIEVLRQRRAMP